MHKIFLDHRLILLFNKQVYGMCFLFAKAQRNPVYHFRRYVN